jgi:hypothetical protein
MGDRVLGIASLAGGRRYMEDSRSTTPIRSSTLGVLAFTIAYLLSALGVALLRHNQEFLLYIVVMVPIVAVVITAHLRVNFSTGVLCGLSLWGLAHVAGGLVPVPQSWPIQGEVRVLYSWWLIPGHLKYDHLVHAFGFGMTAWLCWEALRSIIAGLASKACPDAAPHGQGPPPATVHPTLGMLVLCGAAALGFGALNEVVEFAATVLVPETNVGGYANTGWDLVSNLVGVAVATGLIKFSDAVANRKARGASILNPER